MRISTLTPFKVYNVWSTYCVSEQECILPSKECIAIACLFISNNACRAYRGYINFFLSSLPQIYQHAVHLVIMFFSNNDFVSLFSTNAFECRIRSPWFSQAPLKKYLVYSYYNIKRAKELAWICIYLPSLPGRKSCNNEQKWSVLWNTLFKNSLEIRQLGCHSPAPGGHIWPHLYSTGCPEHRHMWSSLHSWSRG